MADMLYTIIIKTKNKNIANEALEGIMKIGDETVVIETLQVISHEFNLWKIDEEVVQKAKNKLFEIRKSGFKTYRHP